MVTEQEQDLIQVLRDEVALGNYVNPDMIIKALCALSGEVWASALVDRMHPADCFCKPEAAERVREGTYRNAGETVMYIIDATLRMMAVEAKKATDRVDMIMTGDGDAPCVLDLTPAERRMLIERLERTV